ncbi:MAG: SPOR domain-containing protein [Bacteroidales bacterium]
MNRIFLLLMLTILLFQSCDFFQKNDMFSNERDSLLLYRKKQDSLRFMDSIKVLQNKLSSLKNRNKRLIDSLRNEPITRSESSGYNYHLIVGSFKNPEYLNSYNRYVREKGFETKILRNKYGFSLIAVESFNSWRQAASSLEELRESFEKTAWIHVED